jgi:hypothetical protein
VSNRLFILVLILLFAGCGQSGPPSTKTSSSGFATLAERAKFLREYVSFRRSYQTLDFDILYQNNGGGLVPGPSDWDVRLVATVPAAELPDWIQAGVKTSAAPDLAWLTSVPTTLDLSGVSVWYVDGKRIVGLDRIRSIVVYRASSM